MRPGTGNGVPVWPVISLSALLAFSSFVFASLSDAAETFRHLVFFQAAMDLTIFSIALSILLAIEARRNRSSTTIHG